jgi:carboxypeptidase family protein
MTDRPEQRAGSGPAMRWLPAIVLIVTLMGAARVKGQVLYGTLTGTVTDKTGAVIPNVPVTLTDQATGQVRSTTANAQGDYQISNLLPGTYTLSVQQTGFAGFTEKNIVVEINREERVNATLQPAGVTQVVTVTQAAPMLQTETAEVNHEISEEQIAQLPITSSQGRNYQSLYTIIPGAAAVAEQNSTASNPSRAMSLNVNGVEDMSNTTRIDGAVNTYGWLPYLVAYVPPADSIQTVNIVTNSFNAEQGVAGGASINIITKSAPTSSTAACGSTTRTPQSVRGPIRRPHSHSPPCPRIFSTNTGSPSAAPSTSRRFLPAKTSFSSSRISSGPHGAN